MTILVTGGAGFIGCNLVRLLLARTNHRVINLDKLTYAGNLGSLADCMDHPRHCFIRADICDPAALAGIFAEHGPGAVIHLAAESHVDRSIDGPAEFIQTNIIGSYRLLEAALSHYRGLPGPARDAFRFLHVSTDEVYGDLTPEDPPFTEASAYRPRSPYSASKAASDHLARAWHATYGLPVVVTNSSNNYGPHQFPEKLIPMAILKALRDEPIPLYGSGENIRDWLHVEDLSSALIRTLDRGKPGATYNFGGKSEMRNIDLLHMLCAILDEMRPRADGQPHASRIRFVEDRPGHDFRYATDVGKARAELGWQPARDLPSGLRQTVRWYLDNEPWWQAILEGPYKLERLGL